MPGELTLPGESQHCGSVNAYKLARNGGIDEWLNIGQVESLARLVHHTVKAWMVEL
jgi:hypothetical protein